MLLLLLLVKSVLVYGKQSPLECSSHSALCGCFSVFVNWFISCSSPRRRRRGIDSVTSTTRPAPLHNGSIIALVLASCVVLWISIYSNFISVGPEIKCQIYNSPIYKRVSRPHVLLTLIWTQPAGMNTELWTNGMDAHRIGKATHNQIYIMYTRPPVLSHVICRPIGQLSEWLVYRSDICPLYPPVKGCCVQFKGRKMSPLLALSVWLNHMNHSCGTQSNLNWKFPPFIVG